MRKFLAGLAIGIAGTIAAYSFLGRDSRIVAVNPDQPVASREQSASGVVAEAGRGSGNSEPEGDSDGSKPQHRNSIPDPAPGVSPADSDGSTFTANPASSAPGQNQKRDYSAFPPEIADILDTRNPKPLQTRYEAEDREESWATYMEGQLAAYFAQKAELAQFNISQIDCRTSVCEVQAIGYGLDARTVWTTATADIIQQPWHDFRQMSMSTRDPDPGIFAVVLVLARKPE